MRYILVILCVVGLLGCKDVADRVATEGLCKLAPVGDIRDIELETPWFDESYYTIEIYNKCAAGDIIVRFVADGAICASYTGFWDSKETRVIKLVNSSCPGGWVAYTGPASGSFFKTDETIIAEWYRDNPSQ